MENAMKGGHVTLAMFADYSKASDTFDFHILLLKIHKLFLQTSTLDTS